MMHDFIKIQQKFGIREFPHAMFYKFEHALRFELGGMGTGTNRPLRRFIQAFERASTISQTLFGQSAQVSVLVSSYSIDQPDKKRLKPFKLCGLKRSEFEYLGKFPQDDEEHIVEFGSDLFRHWDMTILKDKQAIAEIIWLCIGPELGIHPRIRNSKVYLVDTEKGLLLHVYDDRGMDLVAVQKASLMNIFTEYNDWLLEYDLPQMTATFGNKK